MGWGFSSDFGRMLGFILLSSPERKASQLCGLRAVRPRAGSAGIQHRRSPPTMRLCCLVFNLEDRGLIYKIGGANVSQSCKSGSDPIPILTEVSQNVCRFEVESERCINFLKKLRFSNHFPGFFRISATFLKSFR